MAQQDGLMQNLIQYFLGVENGGLVFTLLVFLLGIFGLDFLSNVVIYFLVQAK